MAWNPFTFRDSKVEHRVRGCAVIARIEQSKESAMTKLLKIAALLALLGAMQAVQADPGKEIARAGSQSSATMPV
jgi:hypothetical protein